MNIENNVPQVPAQPVNQTFVQPSSNFKSVTVIILCILLLITLLIFGAYIYFKEVYEPKSVNLTTNGSTSLTQTTVEPTMVKPTMAYESYTLDLTDKIEKWDNIKKEWAISKPVEATVVVDSEIASYIIQGEGYELMISADYEDEGIGGTEYNENYKLIPSPLYGDIYRVQSDRIVEEYGSETFTYVVASNFKTSGTCEGIYSYQMGLSKAPCGDGLLNISDSGDIIGMFSIYCKASSEVGLRECDKMVVSLSKL
jgi:hypothetical protein